MLKSLSGLAETLRSELLLYSVSVHIFFPGTIFSPGLTQENKLKPKITLKIEEADDGLTPELAAEGLLHGMPSDFVNWLDPSFWNTGVQKGHFHISADLLGSIFRSSTRGSTPHNNVFMDAIYGFIGWVRVPAS